jgi:ABC-type nitrate/sulfonate/bicarbonate transport system ATPase subunit
LQTHRWTSLQADPRTSEGKVNVPVMDKAGVKEVNFHDFMRGFRYRQDQHVTICGPTGCGKSVLIREVLIPSQPYAVYFSTKPRDATIERIGVSLRTRQRFTR